MAPSAHREDEAAYITIVEGPPPEFKAVTRYWTASLAEGSSQSLVAVCETRTMNGDALVQRCLTAWQNGCPCRLDYPRPDGGRAEAEIIAIRCHQGFEGQKLILWIKTDQLDEIMEEDSDV